MPVKKHDDESARRSSHCSAAINWPEDCAFQLGIDGKMVVDEVLITRPMAKELWAKHKPEFVAAVERGESAEAALWVEMCSDTNFQRSLFRIHSSECVIDRGECFVKRPLP